MQVLFGRHNVRVFRFLMRFVDGEATAEDLVSEVFIEVWRNAGQFGARSRYRPGCWRLPVTRRCRRCAGARAMSWTKTSSNSSSLPPTIRKSRCKRPSEARFSAIASSNCRRRIARSSIWSIITNAPSRTSPRSSASRRTPVKTRMFYARKRIGELLAARGLEHALV